MTPTTPVTNLFADLHYRWAAPTARRLFGATKVDANTPISDLPTLARALGGEIRGNQILAPGPGHSAVDRSLAIRLDPAAPDGFFVHSFANDDRGDLPRLCPREVWTTSVQIQQPLACNPLGTRRTGSARMRRNP